MLKQESPGGEISGEVPLWRDVLGAAADVFRIVCLRDEELAKQYAIAFGVVTNLPEDLQVDDIEEL